MLAAVFKLGVVKNQAVMVGDTPYDIEAANRAGLKCIAFRCGGWNDKGLAAASAIYDDPRSFLRAIWRGDAQPEDFFK